MDDFKEVDGALVTREIRQRTDDFLIYVRESMDLTGMEDQETLSHLHWMVADNPAPALYAEEESDSYSSIVTSSAENNHALPYT